MEIHPTSRPVWDEVSIAVADAIRNGEVVARIPLPSPFSYMVPECPLIGIWFEQVRRDFTVIRVELASMNERVAEQLRAEGQRLIDAGRSMVDESRGKTLAEALEAYGRWIEEHFVGVDRRTTPWGRTQTRQVRFLKDHLPDSDLADLDSGRVDSHLDVLRLRPRSGFGRPVSVSWTRNCIKQFRHFLRWLNKRPEFDWKRPADLETEAVRIPLGPSEKALRSRPGGVLTYTRDELRILFESATPFERLLMLLALNCGFGRAEIASLDAGEVFLRCRHPHSRDRGAAADAASCWIMRVRQKSGVYGEWKLWKATVGAIDWWKTQRALGNPSPEVTTLLLTASGTRFDAPTAGNNANGQIPNAWHRLTKRVRKDFPDFPALSFNKLRKTAGNFVRMQATGEVAAVFLCHGTPVGSDALLDLYTNRPFDKVFEALDAIGGRFESLWAAVEDPFPFERKKGGAKVSRGTIRKIRDLSSGGTPNRRIAEILGISPEIVRRWTVKKGCPPKAE